MDHKIKRPFRYIRSESTNIARRFAAIRRLQRMRARATVSSIPKRKVSNG